MSAVLLGFIGLFLPIVSFFAALYYLFIQQNVFLFIVFIIWWLLWAE